jgi:uncharacterized membrane-anchored protein YhcB (DUF1043 family)
VRKFLLRLRRSASKYLPSSRESWLISIAWHISAVLLFFSLFLSQDSREMSLLALFLAVYVHVVVNRRLAERRLETHDGQEDSKRKRDIKKLRDDLTTHLDTTTQALHQDLTTHLDTTTQALHQDLTTHLEKLSDRAIERASQEDLRVERQSHLAASAISFLQTQIQPSQPIWFEKGWAASPGLLAELYLEIRRTKPRLVLDLGSGLTTLVAAYAVAANGTGKVVAWEHLESIRGKSEALIIQHSLETVAKVEFHPLHQIELDGQEYAWFEVSGLSSASVDILVVDSPPGRTGPLARFPAVPLLKEFLSERSTVVLDDCHRPDELATLDKWSQYLPQAELEFHHNYEERDFAFLRTQPVQSPPPRKRSVAIGSHSATRPRISGQANQQNRVTGGSGEP